MSFGLSQRVHEKEEPRKMQSTRQTEKALKAKTNTEAVKSHVYEFVVLFREGWFSQERNVTQEERNDVRSGIEGSRKRRKTVSRVGTRNE